MSFISVTDNGALAWHGWKKADRANYTADWGLSSQQITSPLRQGLKPSLMDDLNACSPPCLLFPMSTFCFSVQS